MDVSRRACTALDNAVSASIFGRLFRLEGSGHKKEIQGTRFSTEIRAGLTTFVTMAYIIAVNSAILSDSGGTCVCKDQPQVCRTDAEYMNCVQDFRRGLVTATACIAGFSSCVFGLLTNMPVCLAPGMGLNAYFAYQIVGLYGSGPISYRVALTAVFTEGFIFFLLALVGMRQWLIKVIPVSLKTASAVGIGLFLAEIGLSYTAGIGAITGSTKTPLEIAGCPPEYLDENGFCTSHKMTNPTMWIGILCGGVFTAYLMAYKVKLSMIAGIALVAIISWPRGTTFTYFPYTPKGDDSFNYFKKVVNFHPMKGTTLNMLDWHVSDQPGQFALAVFTFLYVDIVDATATLFSMARFAGVVDPKTSDFPRSTVAYCTDALCISFGAILGSSPVTAFIESGAGIAEGGRTGLTAFTCGICFLISMFFAPIFASIPPWATGSTLVIVGCLMMRSVIHINWRYIGDAIPAFVTLMFIPFGYSAAYGLIGGMLTYTAMNGSIYVTKLVTRGSIVPEDEDQREYWTINPAWQRPWFLTAAQVIKAHLDDAQTGPNGNEDATSFRTSDTQNHTRHASNASDGVAHELESVVIQPASDKSLGH